MLTIGITGGIGSGKTTVARVIETLGYPVYFSDPAAARLVNEDAAVRTALVDRFGRETYSPAGRLDKERLAALIFNDPLALADANAIIHPAVARDFRAWRVGRDEALLFLESAILFESCLADEFDAVILVSAGLDTRVERVMQRDGVSRDKVLARVHNQPAIDEARADFIIRNNPGDMLVEQVLDIINTLTNTRQWQ
ncbi:MAG: dephospho-CoA kinase [Odoribacteraceae bacterium]|jgi:dephospho-CoA kinase|nr:dephospho-CoA kinase [Odoribacteraceae bacterium]